MPTSELLTLSVTNNDDFLYIGTSGNGLLRVHLNAPVRLLYKQPNTTTLAIHNGIHYVFHEKGLSLFFSHQDQPKNIPKAAFKDFQQQKVQHFRAHTTLKNHFFP